MRRRTSSHAAFGGIVLFACALGEGCAANAFSERCAGTEAAPGSGTVPGKLRDFDELAWKAEGLLDDLEPRRRVLELG